MYPEEEAIWAKSKEADRLQRKAAEAVCNAQTHLTSAESLYRRASAHANVEAANAEREYKKRLGSTT